MGKQARKSKQTSSSATPSSSSSSSSLASSRHFSSYPYGRVPRVHAPGTAGAMLPSQRLRRSPSGKNVAGGVYVGLFCVRGGDGSGGGGGSASPDSTSGGSGGYGYSYGGNDFASSYPSGSSSGLFGNPSTRRRLKRLDL